ncbi:hypothetical protein BS78_02G098200 [Paspalum vaginatum]|nr:hypothetical protein BS78_02G098200 [Paspalum vaginatum]
MSEAEEAEGDRVVEIVSAGVLYHRGGDWERKYWSCSRGKNRYPYPVGYHAVRHFSGISYAMEIQQGPRGPVFLVTSTDGDSAAGQTPDIAWKNFQKKTGANAKNLQMSKSFPQKVDGAELFGFKNASVQRLLRELIVDSTGAVELSVPCAVASEAAGPLTQKNAADVYEAEDLPVCLGMEVGTAKRSIELSQVESASKRAHLQDMFTSFDNCNVSTHSNANEQDPAGRALLQDVSGSRCTIPLLEEVPGNSKYTSLDDNLGEPFPISSQKVGLSSDPYLSSEKSNLELAEKEVAESMLSILLPQAIPLLKKSNKKKKTKHKKKENSIISVRTASAQNPSDGRCRGVAVPTLTCEVTEKISSGMCGHGGSHGDVVKNGFADDECTNDEPVFKLDKMNAFVADSFEDDAHIFGDNTSKSIGVHRHEFADASSRGPNEISKSLYGKTEGPVKVFECQFGVRCGTNAADVVYDHEKGQYILSDSLLACLEEEFGGDDSSHPADFNQCNGDVEQMQFEQQFKELTNGIKSGSSVSMDVSYHKETGNRSICHSDDVRFVDKHVAFESSDKGMHSNDVPQRVSTTKVWPDSDVKMEEFEAGCKNGNRDKMLSVYWEGNVCEHISPIGENDAFPHQLEHSLSVTNHTDDLVSEWTKAQARSDHHLELVGHYQHPMPVLSIMLNTKNHSSLYIYVFCGLLESCKRSLYVYTINMEDQQDAPPHFVGYTPLLLPSLDQSSTGYCSFGRSGLNFTPDGQFLVLLSGIRIPFCRKQNIDCLCSVCKLGRCVDNSLIILFVNLGYVSLITKLIPYGTVSCILICEPNYIIATEDTRNLHIWEMINGWRDISKRTLLATFAAPGTIVFQILPLGFCSLQDDIIATVDDIDKKLREITINDMYRKSDRESYMMPPREDIAVWVLISSASVAEYQHDVQVKECNSRWRLALLAKKKAFMGNVLDTRVTALDASGNYGLAGTHGGLLYLWELSSGRKVTGAQCFYGGRVACVAVDAKSGAVAVTDGGCQVLLYTQEKVLN